MKKQLCKNIGFSILTERPKIKSSGAGLVLQSPEAFMIEYALKLDFPTINNEAEYEAFIAGLGLAKAVRAKNLKVCEDSRLVVAQVNGEFEAKDDRMAKSFVIPYLKFLRPLEVEEALKEAHEGIYGQHLGGRALAHKITRLGFYWPTMLADAKAYVKKFNRCQRHAPIVRQPPERLTSIITPIPFAIWGMDILGSFPAKALAKITTKQIAQFFWENVICQYGIPRILVTDNGKQFDNAVFKEHCDDNSIELRFTSVAHPQANGQAEIANRIILDGLKKRVEYSRNTWVDELLPILWAYHTTCKVTTEATPFMLAYGADAVVPLEITHGSPRIEAYEPETNEEGMRLALDLIDEVRDEGNACNAEHQQRASLYYNRRVKERFFQQGDLVLRKIEASGVGERGKLASNWEGPYKVRKTLGRESYKLETLNGDEVPRTWHASNLKDYYI
ncbi:uncharacterized protein LOC141702338 [Apium graveolens]|uniref:uncharacterized protein LOC141702338 n=1 Tax=Apium graveolens TaxID=4045 RepID=UPI003D7A6BFC